MTEKKAYERPAVRRVRLDVKASVLGYCNTSIDTLPQAPTGGPCTSWGNCPTLQP